MLIKGLFNYQDNPIKDRAVDKIESNPIEGPKPNKLRTCETEEFYAYWIATSNSLEYRDSRRKEKAKNEKL